MNQPQPPKYEDYKNLILKLARKHSQASSLDFDELVAEGNMVFVNAISSFDITREVKFSTYLYSSINQRFLNLRSHARLNKEDAVEAPIDASEASSVNPERMTRLHIALQQLKEDARDVVEITLNTPLDLINAIREQTNSNARKWAWGTCSVTAKAIVQYLKGKGWSEARANRAIVEIRQALKAV